MKDQLQKVWCKNIHPAPRYSSMSQCDTKHPKQRPSIRPNEERFKIGFSIFWCGHMYPILNFSSLSWLSVWDVLCHSVTWMNISELDEYFCTKPFANDPSCLWLSVGGSAPGWGFNPAWGSVPYWA